MVCFDFPEFSTRNRPFEERYTYLMDSLPFIHPFAVSLTLLILIIRQDFFINQIYWHLGWCVKIARGWRKWQRQLLMKEERGSFWGKSARSTSLEGLPFLSNSRFIISSLFYSYFYFIMFVSFVFKNVCFNTEYRQLMEMLKQLSPAKAPTIPSSWPCTFRSFFLFIHPKYWLITIIKTRPDGKTFPVGKESVMVTPPPSVGSVVTFSYERHNQRDLPLHPSIIRVRLDLLWKDVLDSHNKKSTPRKFLNGLYWLLDTIIHY